MAIPKTSRQWLVEWITTKLLAINGGTEWNHDVAARGVLRTLRPIESIGADECPWVAIFPEESGSEMKLGGWHEPDITVSVFLLMKESQGRFQGKTADELTEELLADAVKAITGAAKEPNTNAWMKSFRVTPDVDEELGRWSLKRIDTYWTQPQAVRGT